jgi:putative protease
MYVGLVTNYFSKIGVAEIKIESHQLSVGENIMIIGPTTGVYEDEIGELRLDFTAVEKVKKGDLCSLPVKSLVRRGDKLYKIVAADHSVPNLVQK